VSAAIGNALNNLLGYPHAGQASWADHFSFTQDELRDAMAKWWGARPTDILTPCVDGRGCREKAGL
jgi:hypothetical protein